MSYRNMDQHELEQAIGPRGSVTVRSSGLKENRRAVRAWIGRAANLPFSVVGSLPLDVLEQTYNDTSNNALHDLITANLNSNAEPKAAPRKEPQTMASKTNGQTAPKQNPLDLMQQAVQMIQEQSATAGVDAEQVRELVRAELEQIAERPVQISFDNGEVLDIPTGTEPTTAKAAAAVSAGVPVLLVGPAGCGKTRTAAQVAELLEARTFASLSLTAGTSETELTGRLLPDSTGAFTYRPAPFVDCYENGGLFLFDELDAADPNMLLVVNQALANGSMPLPLRDEAPKAKRSNVSYVMGAANTYGAGGTLQYAGRETLDASTRDRFVILEVTYSSDYEAALIGDTGTAPAVTWEPQQATADSRRELGRWVLSLRQHIKNNGLQRVISTRTLENLLSVHAAGWSVEDCKASALAGWTEDERRGVAA